MPGIIVFRRRWSVGSDDFVVPAVFLIILHTIWLIVLAILYGMLKDEGPHTLCWSELGHHVIGYLALLSGCLVMEALIAFVSMRGTILDAGPRSSMQYLLYIRLVLFVAEVIWLILGVVWLVNNYESCTSKSAKEAILGIVVCNWCVVVSVVITTWCTFDAAGRSWVKMKRYQRSLRDSHTKFQYRRSGNRNRNWRHRKVLRAYQDSWDHRCRLLFCCIGEKNRNSSSFSDIARLLSEFFRDLDVVPSDVVAGLVLLRKYQKEERKRVVACHKNQIFQFLSGVPITPRTQFLELSTAEGQLKFNKIVHFMRYALAVYGWPMYLITSSPKNAFKLCPLLSCCRWCSRESVRTGDEDSKPSEPEVIEDNCCGCNAAGLMQMTPSEGVDLVYVTYHVNVGETPFFVAVDHTLQAIVICIRGTLSMKDVITDLNAESEPLPLDSIREDWLGHKGMVQAAEYIRKKLREDNILDRAFNYDKARGTQSYDLVLVGHSLGAGTASILAILLKQEHPNITCFAYSPPGGLLSMPAVEYSKTFITSVVVGKDVVPRIGLHQMETLRADLISAIQRSKDPKWKTIASSVRCCGEKVESLDDEVEAEAWSSSRAKMRDQAFHPSDSSIALTVHQPLFPPGRILHVVRNHPNKEHGWWQASQPVYQAVWVDNRSFDEVLISPCMIQDHMPDKVLDALEKVMEIPGPAKPQRQPGMTTSSSQRLFNNVENDNSSETNLLLSHSATTPILAASKRQSVRSSPSTPLLASSSTPKESSSHPSKNESKICKGSTPPHRLLLETSFTCTPVSSPGPRPDLRSHINIPGLSWEILSALEDQLLVGGSFARALTEDLTATASAPLASPETLSETSSIVSRVSLLMREAAFNGPRVPSLHHSPLPTLRGQNSSSGYCFYVDTPPSNQRKILPKHESSTDEDDASTPISSAQFPFITLDPILPDGSKDISTEARERTESDGTLKAFNFTSQTSLKEEKVSNGVASPSCSIKASSSSSSVESEREINPCITSSIQSRDSGYGDRAACERESASCEWESILQGGLITPQQEYGKGAPPHIPFYFYTSSSPQTSPSSEYFISPGTLENLSSQKLSPPTKVEEILVHNSKSLSLATPLLNDLSNCARKTYPSKKKTFSNESSV